MLQIRRKNDGKGASNADFAFHIDVAVVFAHNVVAGEKSHPRLDPSPFGGKSRVEQSLHLVLGYPDAGVFDANVHPIVLGVGCDRDSTLALDRFRRVGDEVHKHLVDFTWVATDGWNIFVLLDDFDSAVELMLEERQRRFETFTKIHGLKRGLIQAGKTLETVDDPLDALAARARYPIGLFERLG